MLFFLFPLVCFSQINTQATTQPLEENQSLSGLPADVYSKEYESKKAALYNLSYRDLVEQGYIIEGIANMPLPQQNNAGNSRAVCNDPYIPVNPLTYTAVPRNDDGSLYIADIGFVFSFCGSSYSDLYINTNGNLSFDNPVGQFSPNGFPYPEKMVAPFWADVDTRNTACGQAWYRIYPNYMIVSWEEVGWYNMQCNPLNTFQVIISDGTAPIIGVGNNIQFRYADMAWTTGEASGGGPFGGSAATVGYNSGDNQNFEQVGRFNVDSDDYDGPFDNDDGVHWLDNKCFVFNSGGGTFDLTCQDIVRSLDNNCSITITPDEVGTTNVSGCTTVEMEIDLNTFNCSNEGDNTVTVTATSGLQTLTCTAIVTITTENCPIISLDQVGPLCENDDPLTLSANPPGGTWSPEAPGGTLDPSALGPGFYTVTYTNDNSCPNTISIDVEIFDSPDVTISPDPSQFCEDDGSILLTATGTGGNGTLNYNWQTPSGSGAGTTYNATEAGSYTVTTSDDNGCSAEESTLVEVFPNPDVVIVDPGPICETLDLITLTGAPSGGTWSGTIVSPNGDIYPEQVGPGLYFVSYTYTNSFGCEGTDDINVVITSSPLAFPSNTGPYCEGDPISLFGSTNSSGSVIEYNWTGPNNYTSSAQNPIDATEGGMYILQVVVDGCPSIFEVTEVVVTETPDAIALNDGPYCPGASIQLFGSTPTIGNTTNYEWSGPNNYFSFDQNPTDATEPGNYILTVTVDGCASDPVATEVIFSQAPDASAQNSGPYCEGEPFVLTGQTTTQGSTIIYNWSGPNNYTSNDQNPLDATEAGIYNLTIEVDGCISDTVNTEIFVNALPEPVISGSSTFCENGSSILDAGVFESYIWSDNSTSQTLEVSVEDTYSVTVTDANGCTGIADIFVEQTLSLNPTIVGDIEICDGEVSTLNAGLFDTYLWSNNETTQTIDVSDAQEYSVTVSDLSGCTGETSVVLVVNNNPSLTITGNESFCDGSSSILNGGNFESYIWSDNSTNPTLEVFDSGNYTLEVTDVNGCTATDDIEIVENPNPAPSIAGPSSFCTGNSTILDGGAGYDIYQWSTNEATQLIEVTSGGTIGLTVTDSNGCTGETELEVTENAQLTPAIIGDVDFCEGAASILDAGPGYSTYEWSNGDTTQTIEVNSSGNYGVFVTDASGCSGSDNVNVTVNSNPEPTIGGSTTYCVGGSTILDAGAGYDSYLWSNTESTQSITVSNPGNYSVVVTDQNGCTGTEQVDVQESTSLNPVISGALAFCENDFTILDAGAGFDTYLWSDNSTGQTLQVDLAGNYGITVTDGQGCTGETTVQVDEIAPPSAILTTDTSLCNTEAGGSFLNLFDLIQSGDMNGTWEDVDNSGAVGLFNDLNFNTIPAGDYTFLYTTNSAIAPCPETSYEVNVTVIDCSCPDVNFFNADPLCNGGDILDLTTIENTSEFGTWSIIQTPAGVNPAVVTGTDFDATNADIGEYILQFELINQPPPGCTNSFQAAVFVESAVNAGTADLPLSYCFNEDQDVDLSSLINGEDVGGSWTEISGTPSQGNAFDPTTGSFSTNGQIPGTYTFQYEVSSTGACPNDIEEVEVIINELPIAIAGDEIELNCYNTSNSLDATGSSSGLVFDITWNGPGVVIDGNENTITPTVDQSGAYEIVITNTQTGCISNDFVNVTEDFTAPQVFAGSDENITCDESVITLQAQGDIGAGFEILWQGPGINAGNENDPNAQVDIAGVYTVTTTNLSNGCVSSASSMEVFDDTVDPDIFVETPLNDLDCNTTSLDLIGGSINNASFEWIFNSSSVGAEAVLTGVSIPGIYTLIVTDNITGCTSSEDIQVFQNIEAPFAEAGSPQLLNCFETEVTLDGTASENSVDIIYQWTGPIGGILGSNTNNTATAILPGTYTLLVENTFNGCTSTDEVIVDQNISPPSSEIIDPDELDCTVTEVTLDGSLSSSGNNFSYTWTDPTCYCNFE